MRKRILAILAAAVLAVGMIPTGSAWAAEAAPEETRMEAEEREAIDSEAKSGEAATGETIDAEPSAATADTGTQTTVTSGKTSTEISADADVPVTLTADMQPLDVTDGDAGLTALYVSAQVDGTAPWDDDDDPGDDSSESNSIIRTFDDVNYTLFYITELADDTKPVDSGTLCVEFTLPCGPDVAYFNLNTVNWMTNPVVTYYPTEGDPTTEYTNGMEVAKQVLTGTRALVNTTDVTAIPGTGTLSIGISIGAATNGTELTPQFTAWMDGNDEADYKTAGNVQKLTISAAQKYHIGILQSSEMDIAGTYDLSTGGTNAPQDTVSNATSVRGRMEGYGITVMMQNDSVDKGLKGLEFPTGTITFDLTLSEQSESSSGADLSTTAGYTPVMWDYNANLRRTTANGGSIGLWERTWVYTNAANRDCAYGAAPFNKLGCHTYSSIYDSCYDGGTWSMEQDEENPLVYHVTIQDYTIDYENYNFPTANNTWYRRTEGGTVYTANQACFSAGTVQMVLQFPEDAVERPTHIYYKMVADNFKVDEEAYNATATFSRTYQLVPEGSINSGTNFTDNDATTRAQASHQLGSTYMSGDAYSFRGTDIRLWGYIVTSTDDTVHTDMTLIKFDADAFEVNRGNSTYDGGRFRHGSGEGAVNSWTRYFAGRKKNWDNEQVMSDTLINSTDLHYYLSLDDLEDAGYVCVGCLYVADVANVHSSSQSSGEIGLTVKDTAELNHVYAACNDAWASYSTIDELTTKYGALIQEDGTINTEWTRNGYDLYKAYCSQTAYQTMKTTIESGNNGDFWYHKTVYDDSGNIIGGHEVGYYGGTSLLICGEKGTVEISVDRTVYDMDAGQRTAEVTVTPAVVVDGNASSETGDKGTTTTTATVCVTLPADLTYDTGTAYWGDIPITPEITTNADGSTTLTFILEDVTLGATLDALTFSCTIGHAGTADDVTNNESIALNATIESTNDHRAKTESYGNSSNTSFNVIRLSATSVAKSVDPPLIEQGGSFTWTLRYYNGGDEEIEATNLADVFPKNGDSLGSSFSGSYEITGIEVDFSEAEDSYDEDDANLHFYVSNAYTGSGKDLAQNDAPTTWTDLMNESTRTDDAEKKIITLDTNEASDMNAFYCDLGDLEPGETLVLRISVETVGNAPADLYNNVYYEAAADQEAPVQSNLVSTQVVRRTISGCTWVDANADGIRDTNEALLAGVKVSLYTVDEEEPQPADADDGDTEDSEDLTPAVDVYGNEIPAQTTGADGTYCFEALPGNADYCVRFEADGERYDLTLQDTGDDDTVDSDAGEISDEDSVLLAEITGISLPTLEEMDRYLYESDSHDAGYIALAVEPDDPEPTDPTTTVKPPTGGGSGTTLRHTSTTRTHGIRTTAHQAGTGDRPIGIWVALVIIAAGVLAVALILVFTRRRGKETS